MDEVTVKIVNKGKQPLPEYATRGAAGMDVRANIDEPYTLAVGARTLVPTGLYVELPRGYELQLRPRSGLALRNGITLVNSPGTVDADYRGEIGVIVANMGSEPFVINPGERICQMVVTRYSHVTWELGETLDDTARGDGGFGHTGLK